MKIFLPTFLLLILWGTAFAQNYSISNVVFTPPSPDTLLPGEEVNFTYDYTKTGGDIRISGRPWKYQGNAGMSGYSLIQDDAGSNDGRFLFFNGGKVDSVRFEFVNLDWTTLYDTVIPVDYTWLGFYINTLELTPASPGILEFGDSIKFNFSYEKTYGDVKIQPFAMAADTIIAGQVTSVSPVYQGNTGTGSGFIRFDDFTTVDQIMFQFLDAATGDTLVEVERDVFFSFTNDTSQKYTISNVVCTPPSGSIVKLNEGVNWTFDYTKPYGDERIYMDPIVSEGSWNYGHSGSSLYTENTGSGDAFFVFFDEAKIEQLRFRFQSASGLIIKEHYEDVFFSVTADSSLAYSITDIEFTPPSPKTLNTGDTIKVKFNYTKPFGDVFFFLKPLKTGNLVPGFDIPNLGAFSADSGSVETYIIYDIPTSFDQLQIQMKTSLSRTLFEEIVNVNYTFQRVPFSVENLTLMPASPDSINIRESISIGFVYKNLDELARVIVTPLNNGQELTGFESSNPINLVNNSGTVNAFIRFNDVVNIDQIKIQVMSNSDEKSSLNTIIYEQVINVDYVFKIPTSSVFFDLKEPVVFPNPAEGKFFIRAPINEFNYSVVNIVGQTILKGFSTENNKTIEIGNFDRGIYFVNILYGSKEVTRKIIIQ